MWSLDTGQGVSVWQRSFQRVWVCVRANRCLWSISRLSDVLMGGSGTARGYVVCFSVTGHMFSRPACSDAVFLLPLSTLLALSSWGRLRFGPQRPPLRLSVLFLSSQQWIKQHCPEKLLILFESAQYSALRTRLLLRWKITQWRRSWMIPFFSSFCVTTTGENEAHLVVCYVRASKI